MPRFLWMEVAKSEVVECVLQALREGAHEDEEDAMLARLGDAVEAGLLLAWANRERNRRRVGGAA